LIIGKKKNMQVLSNTFTTSPHSHLGHWGTCRTVTPVYLFPPRTRRPPGYSTSPRQRAAGPHHLHVCSPIRKLNAPISDTGRVHNMFTIESNKSLVNFTGSNVLRLQKPNHASHLTDGGIWYQCVHCLNLSHSQHGKVCCTLYWTHHMTHQLQWNNCAGCMRKRSLLSRCPTYKLTEVVC
jgi:hypothetical protein